MKRTHTRSVKRQSSAYERNAIEQIHAWKNPEIDWFGKAMAVVNWPLNKAGDLVLSTPGLGPATAKAIQGIVSAANDVAQWSVRPAAIYKEYQARGHCVSTPSETLVLDLEDIDKTIGWLGAKYKGLALMEGGRWVPRERQDSWQTFQLSLR